jgi:Domain of unknown function (DUF4349)
VKNKIFLIVLSLVFLAGCGSYASQESSYGSSANTSANRPVPSSTAPKDSKTADIAKGTTTQLSTDQAEKSKPPENIERKIIRNADLTLEANAPEEIQRRISSIAESKGGFVVESQQSSSSSEIATRDTVRMTVRIPAEKFNESLEEIRKSGNRVVVETVKGEDVTEEFLDVEARLKTKKALEEQFIQIMKQGKTVEEALSVQRELANVREEIEKVEGRKRFLENQASLSTIKILIQTPNSLTPSSSGFFYKLGQSISSGFDAALGFVLFFVTAAIALLPFLILVVLPIYLIIRYLLRKWRKQRLAREIVRDEVKEDIKDE